MTTKITLTTEQRNVLFKILNFLQDPDTSCAVLSGSAGTGKTALMAQVVIEGQRRYLTFIGLAPTHKAKGVLRQSMGIDTVITVSSFLYRIKNDRFIATVASYRVIICDEISMITDNDMDKLMTYARRYNKKLLLVGDPAQIPNPSQPYRVREDTDGQRYLVKAISKGFEVQPHFRLCQIIRQKGNNLLSQVIEHIRQHGTLGASQLGKTGESNGIIWTRRLSKFLEYIKQHYCQQQIPWDQLRIISYTNQSVQAYNYHVRQFIHKDPSRPFYVGELLTGYQNIKDSAQLVIENGQDYYIDQVELTDNYTLVINHQKYERLCGYLITPKGSAKISWFFPQVNHPRNHTVILHLLQAYKKYQQIPSYNNYQEYIQFKSKLFFHEDVYLFNRHIYTLSQLRRVCPDICVPVLSVIKDNQQTGRQIREEIPQINLLRTKCQDLLDYYLRRGEALTANEMLYDYYHVLPKDIDYGYAITAHKSQGSTYHTVFIDDVNFQLLKDCWNYNKNMLEMRSLERRQLEYVAFTRPRHLAIVYI